MKFFAVFSAMLACASTVPAAASLHGALTGG